MLSIYGVYFFFLSGTHCTLWHFNLVFFNEVMDVFMVIKDDFSSNKEKAVMKQEWNNEINKRPSRKKGLSEDVSKSKIEKKENV